MALVATLVDLFSMSVLIATFVILASRLVKHHVYAYTAQNVLLAGVSVLFALQTGHVELYVLAGFILVIRAWLIPRVLRGVNRAVREQKERTRYPYVGLGGTIALSLFLVILVIFLGHSLALRLGLPSSNRLAVGVSVFVLGILVMTLRRQTVPQVVGFLTAESGVTLVALLAASSFPFIVELLLAADLIAAVLILKQLIHVLDVTAGTTDTMDLRRLQG